MPGMQRSFLLEDLDDDTITALTAVTGPGSGSPLPIVQIRHFGGAMARTPEGAGSHGPVTEPYNLFALGVPAVPELVEVISMFFGRIGAAVAGVASGRTLLNFQESGEDPGLWWSAETRERLVRAKQAARPAPDDPQQPPRPRLTSVAARTCAAAWAGRRGRAGSGRAPGRRGARGGSAPGGSRRRSRPGWPLAGPAPVVPGVERGRASAYAVNMPGPSRQSPSPRAGRGVVVVVRHGRGARRRG